MKTPTVQKIRKQNGLAAFKQLVDKWDALSDQLCKTTVEVPMILPDLFLIAGNGGGKSHCLRLLSEFLSEKENLMRFYGDVKYFEFLLNYCAPDAPFTEIRRLMTEIDNAAGFRNVYRGIVCIDINDWKGHCEEKYFMDFMEYLADNSDDWLVVLAVTDSCEEEIEIMETVVSAFLRTERLVIEPPTVQELLHYAERVLSTYTLSLTPEAKKLLSASIDAVRQGKYFDGYKTVKMLCRDIAYTVFSEGRQKKTLDETVLAGFAKDSAYIQRMIYKIEKIQKMGFC